MTSFIAGSNQFASPFYGGSAMARSVNLAAPATAPYQPLLTTLPMSSPAPVSVSYSPSNGYNGYSVKSAPDASLYASYSSPSAVAGDVLRVNITPLKPNAKDKIQCSFKDKAVKEQLMIAAQNAPGSKFQATFFAEDDKLVNFAVYDSMENSVQATANGEPALGVGVVADNLAGPPTTYSGIIEFYYRGPGKLQGESVSSRVTILPLKPGTKSAVLDLLNNKMLQQMLQDDAFGQMVDMRGFFHSDDTLLLVSRFRRLAGVVASESKQKEFLAPLIPYVNGAPDRLFGVLDWSNPKILVIKRPPVKMTGCC